MKNIMRLIMFCMVLFATVALAETAKVSECSPPYAGSDTLWTATADTLDTHCLTASGAAASTADIAMTADFTYVIDNRLYSDGNGTQDISAMGNAADIEAQSTSTYCRHVFTINTSGTVDVFCGTSAASAALALYPEIDEGECPFAGLLIATNSTATFTLGTTALSGAGATATFEDLYALPSQAIDR